MATKVRTNVYLDRELKEKAKELPLEEIIPKETLKVIKEAREGKNMRQITLEELKDSGS